MTPTNPAKDLKQATIAVHGVKRTDAQQFGVVVSPVLHSATFAFQDFDEMRRYARVGIPDTYFYSSYANPTVAEAERKLLNYPALCAAGDDVIATDSVYGGTAGVSAATARFALGI
jgi:cystathionine beta-lyase/cystathionine gamma-synthase